MVVIDELSYSECFFGIKGKVFVLGGREGKVKIWILGKMGRGGMWMISDDFVKYIYI